MPPDVRDSTPTIRAAAIEGFAELVRRLGGQPAPLLANAGLDARVLVEPDLRVPADRLLRLLELAAIETGADDFGLRLAQMHGLANLGPIGILAREERSVGAAMQTLIDYLYLHNSATHLRIDSSGEPALIGVFVQGEDALPGHQGIDLAMGATVGVLRAFLGARWNPGAAQFVHAAPAHPAAHRHLFRCPVEFDASVNALLVTRADLAAPLHSSSPAFQRQVRQWIEGLAERSRSESAFSDDVRRLIAMLLSTGRCSADRLAGFYGVSRRTIHRRLEHSGQSFSDLMNEVRRDLADERVSEGRLGLGEISHALGFDQQSSFSRWFRREFGMSAMQWRRNAGGSGSE